MNQFLARLDRCSEIGSLDSYGWYPSGHRPMANLEGACYVPGHIAPGLRSSRLLLESEPLLRSVLVSYMKPVFCLICASASWARSHSDTVLLEITRNCPCVVSRSQQNNSRSRFVSFPSLSVQNQSSQRGWSCASRVGGAASREAARNMVVRGER